MGLNPQTGILSNVSSNFSTDNWGGTTWSYLKSIEKMKTGSLEEIVELAIPFMSPLKSCHQGQELSQGHQSLTEDGNNFCVCLADTWYVPFIFLSMVPAANMNGPKRLPSCHTLAEKGKIIFGIVWL